MAKKKAKELDLASDILAGELNKQFKRFQKGGIFP